MFLENFHKINGPSSNVPSTLHVYINSNILHIDQYLFANFDNFYN